MMTTPCNHHHCKVCDRIINEDELIFFVDENKRWYCGSHVEFGIEANKDIVEDRVEFFKKVDKANRRANR